MTKFLVHIQFEWNEETMKLIPRHRAYINELIDQQVIEHYAVSMEIQSLWITINAVTKSAVRKILAGSPFYHFWTITINELIVWDGQNYRLPVVQLN